MKMDYPRRDCQSFYLLKVFHPNDDIHKDLVLAHTVLSRQVHFAS